MEEIYHKKNINYVFGRKLFVDKIEYNDHELKIFLDNENIKLQLCFTYIFSSRIIDEGCFLKTLNKQNLTIGLYYSCKSNYLSWFHEQSSNIYLDDYQLKHYNKHGKDLNSDSPENYLNQAKKFKGSRVVKNIKGDTQNVTRYYKNGKYIYMVGKKIISFGKQ